MKAQNLKQTHKIDEKIESENDLRLDSDLFRFWPRSEGGCIVSVSVCRTALFCRPKLNIFKNGKLITSSIRKLTPTIFRKDQYFGKSNWSGNSYFNGELDDLRLYDRAITEAEVRALHAMGEASK